jgi:uncharacterized membrane protein
VVDQSSQWPAQYPALKQQYRVQTQFNPALRAATADRERTVDVLKAGFAEGRLTQDEYNDRMGKAYDARTYGELAALIADLPAGVIPPLAPGFLPGPPARKTANSLAIASMILGIAEIPTLGITAIPAIVCGHKARQEMRESGEPGDGMAVVGLVLGYLGVIAWTLIIIGVVLYTARQAQTSFPQGGPP